MANKFLKLNDTNKRKEEEDIDPIIAGAIAGKIGVVEFTVGARSGRITLSNGLCAEWGYYDHPGYTGTGFSQLITYTHEFSSIPSIQVSHNQNKAYYLNVSATGVTTTGFNLNFRRTDTTSTNLTVTWLVIGKRSGY